jgi:ABC-type sugar transport system substrate-binding protein
MIRFTRFARLALALAGAALLAACSGGADKSAGGDAARPADKPIVLGFSQIGAESEWRTANTTSVQNAAKEAGITLRFSDAQQKQENQIKALRSFIAQRVDVIAFSPVVETGWETVLREAQAAKIPVILTDRAVDVTDDSLYVTFHGLGFPRGRPQGGPMADRALHERPLQGREGRHQHRRAAGHGRLRTRQRSQEGFCRNHCRRSALQDHPLADR